MLDSSGWLECLADAPNGGCFAPAIDTPEILIVAALSILEVFRRVLRERGKSPAL